MKTGDVCLYYVREKKMEGGGLACVDLKTQKKASGHRGRKTLKVIRQESDERSTQHTHTCFITHSKVLNSCYIAAYCTVCF